MMPSAGALPDGVPGPPRIRVDPVHQLDLRLDPPGMARHPNPIVLGDAETACRQLMNEQPVLPEDLAQAGILRVPGMVHLHRPLGDCVQRKAVAVDALALEGRVPDRQWVEIALDARSVLLGRLPRTVALRRQSEALQR